MLAKALRIADGSVSGNEIADWLQERDERLRLDVDVSWCNYFLLEQLVAVFPSARFIVLVRDCYTWMESIIGHMLTREIPPDAREFMEFWFRTSDHPHGDGEQRLKEAGLFSLTAHLETWNEHITKCVAMIPTNRLFVVRTHELAACLPALAKFLGVPMSKLDSEQCHLNRGTWQGRIQEYVDVGLVEEMVVRTCSDSMGRYFPEVSRINDAYSLWNQ